jgi:lipopolysaccharide export system permease protein
MQLLWKYIDDILGKGVTMLEMLELIFYYSVTLIPLAVPITILIASVMVFGDISEKYELSSMKSAGVSLLRIMLPGIMIATGIGFYSIVASNFLKPSANLQFQKRFVALRKQKAALAIEEGIFNDAFGETVIRINKIDEDGKGIHDVLVYDHNIDDKSLVGLLSSKGGQMYTAEGGKYFVMQLDTGVQYREPTRRPRRSGGSEYPFTRIQFDQWTKLLDMSLFDFDDGLLNFNSNREDMMHTGQLLTAIDTFNHHIRQNDEKIERKVDNFLSPKYTTDAVAAQLKPTSPSQSPIITQTSDTSTTTPRVETPQVSGKGFSVTNQPKDPSQLKDSLRRLKDKLVHQYRQSKGAIPVQATKATTNVIAKPLITKKLVSQDPKSDAKRFLYTTDTILRSEIISKAITDLSNDRDEMMTLKSTNFDYNRLKQKHLLRLHQQYAWAAVCLVFLFIGAPLGSIVRKGGYGYPLLFAILFYMIFIITSIYGEKLVKNHSMGGVQAAWLPCLVLLPFAALLTYMALKDLRFQFYFIDDAFHKMKRYFVQNKKEVTN